MSRLGLAWDLLRAEGPRGLAVRLADRAETLRERMAERDATPARLAAELARGGRPPVLDVLATPPETRFGGVPVQFVARLPEERRLRATALLAPERGWWTLRTASQGERRRVRLRRVDPEAGPARGPGAATEAVVEAADLLGAQVVNVEGAAGWTPEALLSVAGCRARLVLSLHDFALYCPRPSLTEEPDGLFCRYSRGAERCHSCLAATWRLPRGFVEAWRESSARLLLAADAVVFPSEFLKRQHRELFPAVEPRREQVIAPAAPASAAAEVPAVRGRSRGREPGDRLHVAFIGSYRRHKGAAVFENLLRRSSGGAIRWSILGDGDPKRLLGARRLGARVVGHYRAGGIPGLLRREGVDVGLLLSTWPETFSLTLTECRSAGVPVVAFALGAIADRIRSEGGGLLVPAADGANGVSAALHEVLADPRVMPPFLGTEAGPSPSRVAAERLELYRTLLAGVP